MKSEKKFRLPAWLNLVLIGLEVVVMILLLVLSIIMVVNKGTAGGTPLLNFVKWMSLNPVASFMIVVFPLIVLFLFNVYLLIRTLNSDKDKKLDIAGLTKEELLEEARRQAKEELLKEMENSQK